MWQHTTHATPRAAAHLAPSAFSPATSSVFHSGSILLRRWYMTRVRYEWISGAVSLALSSSTCSSRLRGTRGGGAEAASGGQGGTCYALRSSSAVRSQRHPRAARIAARSILRRAPRATTRPTFVRDATQDRWRHHSRWKQRLRPVNAAAQRAQQHKPVSARNRVPPSSGSHQLLQQVHDVLEVGVLARRRDEGVLPDAADASQLRESCE